MWIISFRDDLSYEDLYEPDYIWATGKTKKECEKDFKNRHGESMYAKNRYRRIMYSKPHNQQFLIYEI